MLILMAQWKNKVALITGLSKGIREVAAPKFATMGI
jgi:NADP-dependent 3-hydroxy acid dehydrogenase YdfG